MRGIPIEKVLGNERVVTALGLVAVVGWSWLYLWTGAGTGMSALDMTALTLFPHRLKDGAGGMETTMSAAILMWWTMMIAMMTPGAAPLILLYRRVLRHHEPAATHSAIPSLFLFAGYLTAWLAFSILAAILQQVLQPTGLVSDMMLWSKSAPLSACFLAVAGFYQFSPLKRACLRQCRAPVAFLTAYWRPGLAGSFLLGVRHGFYCVGCCWLLMTLLFVGGVMNLAWIAALSVVVLVEKLAPRGEQAGRLLGVVLIAWAVATLLV
ncbi:hypothetical protein LMG22037_03444 [Paraburkholderia phenoliruptrix]|uniref:Metal-binding integral membrane protein n=1 Tax=Paraburkholderia phenoliruptrix TaxID=252970 RepID=A0A6J5BBX7_9BURK|nr:DUF2182 domain-containing protein [Paraburkholderia phenoliruptrix]CAB3699857.1 hypothetical protein LMG22037_03444 [Paraburkholderia phenoliruptrix]